MSEAEKIFSSTGLTRSVIYFVLYIQGGFLMNKKLSACFIICMAFVLLAASSAFGLKCSLSGTFADGEVDNWYYNNNVEIVGYTTMYSYSVEYTGELPPGLELQTGLGCLYLSGTPKKIGTYDFEALVSWMEWDNDGVTNTCSGSFSVTITGDEPDPPSIYGSFTSTRTVGTPYSSYITATGGTSPYTFTYSGNKPSNLDFKSSSNRYTLSGTPDVADDYTFNVTVTDYYDKTATKTFTVSIKDKDEPEDLEISGSLESTTSLLSGYVSTLTATGGSGSYTWSYSGTLPNGLSFPTSATGSTYTLSGLPTKTGIFENIYVTVTDSNGKTAQGSYTITVNERNSGLSISGSLTSTATQYASYSSTLTATGGSGSYIWAHSGTLPKGLEFSQSGNQYILDGSPTETGNFENIKVTLSDSNGKTTSNTYSIYVSAAVSDLKISGTLDSLATRNTSYSSTLTASGGTGSYTWSYSGTLPGGLTFPTSATGSSYTLSGSPTGTGKFEGIIVTVKDSDGNEASGSYVITVNNNSSPVSISGSSDAMTLLEQYENFSHAFTASGGSGSYIWSYSGKLPSGLTFPVSATGSTYILSGSANEAGTFDDITVTLTDANDSTNTATTTYRISVTRDTPSISGSLESEVTQYSSYYGTLTASGGSGSYSWTYSGNYPEDLTFTPSGSTLTLSGNLQTADTYDFSITVTDDDGYSSTKYYTIVVSDSNSDDDIEILYTFKEGTVGEAYSDFVIVSGDLAPYEWTYDGNPPTEDEDGIHLVKGTLFAEDDAAYLRGTPKNAKTYYFSLIVNGATGATTTKSFSVKINEASSGGGGGGGGGCNTVALNLVSGFAILGAVLLLKKK